MSARTAVRVAALTLMLVAPAACARSGEPEGAAPPDRSEAPQAPQAPAAREAPEAPSPSAGGTTPAAPAQPSAPARPSGPAPATDQSPAGWTAGIVRGGHPAGGVATLRAVRVAAHDGFDRVVFEFAGDTLPGHHLEYVDRPVRACGSGDPVPLAGDAWLSVRMEPARAHDDQGRATLQNRAFRPDVRLIREMKLICDFEAQVEWVLGVASPNRFRVLELRSPARLVVDIRHGGR